MRPPRARCSPCSPSAWRCSPARRRRSPASPPATSSSSATATVAWNRSRATPRPVHLDEFEPRGGFATSIALPTAENEGGAGNKPITDSGTATSDGGLTLSGNGECLLTVGIDAKPRHRKKSSKRQDTANPRVVAVVNGAGEVNTDHRADQLRQRKQPPQRHLQRLQKTLGRRRRHQNHGGVLATEVGNKRRDPAQRRQERPPGRGRRQPAVRVRRSDPDRQPSTIATGRQRLCPLPKARRSPTCRSQRSPEEPYAYSLLTLGLGSTPDTLYVADNEKAAETSAIVKYGLSEGKWVEHGSVEIPEVTGVHGQRRQRSRHDLRHQQRAEQQGRNPVPDRRRQRRQRHAQRRAGGNRQSSDQRGLARGRLRARDHDRLRRHAAAVADDLGGGNVACRRRSATRPTKRCRSPSKTQRLPAKELTVTVSLLEGIRRPRRRDQRHRHGQGTGPARHPRRSRSVQADRHRGSARRRVLEHADQLRSLRERGLRKRPLLLRERRPRRPPSTSVAGT